MHQTNSFSVIFHYRRASEVILQAQYEVQGKAYTSLKYTDQTIKRARQDGT